MSNDFNGTISSSATKRSSLKEIILLANNCNNDFEFFVKNYAQHAHEKGNLYTWGSGEMG